MSKNFESIMAEANNVDCSEVFRIVPTFENGFIKSTWRAKNKTAKRKVKRVKIRHGEDPWKHDSRAGARGTRQRVDFYAMLAEKREGIFEDIPEGELLEDVA